MNMATGSTDVPGFNDAAFRDDIMVASCLCTRLISMVGVAKLICIYPFIGMSHDVYNSFW